MSRGRCDVCGKTGQTEQLLELYSTKDIEFVCDDCGKDINSTLHKIQGIVAKMQGVMLRRFIEQLKARKQHQSTGENQSLNARPIEDALTAENEALKAKVAELENMLNAVFECPDCGSDMEYVTEGISCCNEDCGYILPIVWKPENEGGEA